MSANPDQSKLRWRCRRGTKELDTLTERYLDEYFADADTPEQLAFASLLELQDPELYQILTREVSAPNSHISAIVKKIHRL